MTDASRDFWNAIDPSDRDRLLQLFESTAPSSSGETEIEVETANGRKRFAIRATALPSGDTEQRTDLETAEQKYLSLIESVNVVVWQADPATFQFQYVSNTIERFGYTVEQALQPGWWVSWLHPFDRDWAVEYCERQIVGHHDHSFEYRVIAPDGAVQWVRDVVAVRTVNGKTELYGVFVDITDTRLEQLKHDESEERFRSLIEHSSDIICVMNPVGMIEYKSPSIFSALGYTPEELIGTSLYDEILKEDGPIAREAVEQLLETEKPQQVLLRAKHRDETVKSFLVMFSKLERKDGLHIVANARDITERRMLEASLEQAQRMTSLGHLAAKISHEMNNVLMAIQPNVEYIARVTPDDAKLQRVVQSVKDSVRRGSRMTQEILRFTKPAVPRLRPVDVGRWLNDLARDAKSILGPKIELTVSVPDDPPHINGDTAALNQAFTNILLNARDAMDGQGRIEIAVAGASELPTLLDEFVHLSIRDTGSGMPPHVSERIFEPLFTTKARGMGLGLGVVHHIITAHQGMVKVDTAEGEGTTFHIFLPRTQQIEKPAPARATQIPHGLRVLIVEDELPISTGLSYILSLEGAEVRVLDRGTGAIEMIEEFQPAVVVLDVSLPDMNGTEIFAKLRERWKSLPVIFSTGHADAGRLHALLAPPIVDVALKPYETSVLLGMIQDAISVQPVP
ncbi:MAG TPA: PAS domain S-box protein [Thermoanaerobaculia bacterium]|nr:PAS domain S-box protein [Thermoanaerobaculia bacterium]